MDSDLGGGNHYMMDTTEHPTNAYNLDTTDYQTNVINSLRYKKWLLNIIMSFLACLVAAYYGLIFSRGCSAEYKDIDFYTDTDAYDKWQRYVYNPMQDMVVGFYVILGFVFFTVGCIMTCRLKKYFPEFYD